MSLTSVNPLYSEYVPDQVTMRDCYEGERVIKRKGEQYLPATSGMYHDGMKKGQPGYLRYKAYKERAIFPDFVADAVDSLTGFMNQKPPVIELPSVMEPLRERATLQGESLNDLLRNINAEQLTSGRLGLLGDLPTTPDPANPLPYIAMYAGETVKNWDDGQDDTNSYSLNLVVLDESGWIRQDMFEWTYNERYRVLQLGELDENESSAVYSVGIFDQHQNSVDYVASAMEPPMLRGQTLNRIPFTFVNAADIVSTPAKPPLIGLAHLALAVYRGEADYRQNLFMQGQDTLVTSGQIQNNDVPAGDASENSIRTGAGSHIQLDTGGDAKYIGVESQGLEEQRSALENDYKRAEAKTGQLTNTSAGRNESGEALKTRINAQTTTLVDIAQAGAAGLEDTLKNIARWLGADPEQVSVEPNLDFADYPLTGEEVVKFMTGRAMGAPLSKQSLHALMVERGITKMDYDSEIATIEEENAAGGNTPAGVGIPSEADEDE